MVAAPRMDREYRGAFDELLRLVISTAHSRFPVYQGRHHRHPRGQRPAQAAAGTGAEHPPCCARPPLCRKPRAQRPAARVSRQPQPPGHRDRRFGRVAVSSPSDVLEQIVGEIEDGFDIPEDEGDIFGLADRTYRVSDTPSACGRGLWCDRARQRPAKPSTPSASDRP